MGKHKQITIKEEKILANRQLISQKRAGFTLVEILAVLVILGVIGLIAIPVVNKVVSNTREKLYDVQINYIANSAELWAAGNVEELPKQEGDSITLTLGQLKQSGAIKEDIKNPKTEELFPNDMEIEIKLENNRYVYEVKEGSGGNGEYDSTLATIILNGKTHEYVEINTEYVEYGAEARDPFGRIISDIDITIKKEMKK